MGQFYILTQILQGNGLSTGKIYTAGKFFTRPPVVTFKSALTKCVHIRRKGHTAKTKTVLKPVNQRACKNGYFKLCEVRITLILGQNFETCILASHGRIIRLPAVFVLWVIALNRPLDRAN